MPTLDDVGRGKWGSPASPVINTGEENSRPHWGDGKGLQLSKVPLETTGSAMEGRQIRATFVFFHGLEVKEYAITLS